MSDIIKEIDKEKFGIQALRWPLEKAVDKANNALSSKIIDVDTGQVITNRNDTRKALDDRYKVLKKMREDGEIGRAIEEAYTRLTNYSESAQGEPALKATETSEELEKLREEIGEVVSEYETEVSVNTLNEIDEKVKRITDKISKTIEVVSELPELEDKSTEQDDLGEKELVDKDKPIKKAVYMNLLSGNSGSGVGRLTIYDYGKPSKEATELRKKHLEAMGKGYAMEIFAQQVDRGWNPIVVRAAMRNAATVLDDPDELEQFKKAFYAEWTKNSPAKVIKKATVNSAVWLAEKATDTALPGIKWVGDKTGITPVAQKAAAKFSAASQAVSRQIDRGVDAVNRGVNVVKGFDSRLSDKSNTSWKGKTWRRTKKEVGTSRTFGQAVLKLGTAAVTSTIRNAAGAVGSTIKSAATAVVGAQTVARIGKVASTLSSGASALGATAKLGGSFAGSGSKAILPAAAIGFSIAGPAGVLPAVLAGSTVAGVAGTLDTMLSMNKAQFIKSPIYKAVSFFGEGPTKALNTFYTANKTNLGDLVKSNTYLNQLGNNSRKLFSGVATSIRSINSGMTGAGIGSGIGFLLTGGNPLGGLIGATLGGGVGVAGQVIGDRISNIAARNAAAQGLLSPLKALPLQGIQGLVSGKMWLQSFMRANILGKAVGMEKSLYGLTDADGKINLVAAGLNLANILGYTMSSWAVSSAIFKGGFAAVGKLLNPTGRIAGILGSGAGGMLAGGGLGGVIGLLVGAAAGQPLLGAAVGVGAGMGVSKLSQSLASIGATTTLSAKALTAINIGNLIGGLAGSAGGIALATALGLNVGTFAAIGGMIGGTIGGIVGGAIGGVSGGIAGLGVATPITSVAGATIGSTIFSAVGSFLGTLGGSILDTLFGSLLPAIPNPLTILQGVYDMYKWMSAPLRNLGDYAAIGLTAISLVTFLVAMERTMIPDNSAAGSEVSDSESSGNRLIFSSANSEYSPDNLELILNKGVESNFSFSNITELKNISASQFAFTADGRYWLIENSSQYTYNPTTESLVGTGKNVTAKVYNYATVAGVNNEQEGTAANANTSSKSLQQISFCEVYTGLCTKAGL